MSYCEKEDIGLSNTELLRLCDDNDTGEWGEECQGKFDKWRDAADARIDTYAMKQYPLPFETTPEQLRTASALITKYYLYLTRNAVPEGLRKEYEDQIKWLESLAAGKVGLDGITKNVVKPKARIYTNRKRSDRKFYDGLQGY